MNHWTEGIDI